MYMRDIVIRAAGGLLWRDTNQGREIALVYRAKHDDWSLPKGKLKRGEDWLAAALREVSEETGCEVSAGDYAGSVHYTVDGRLKEVRFWHMRLTGDCDFTPSNEIQQPPCWLSVSDALAKLTYTDERDLLAASVRMT